MPYSFRAYSHVSFKSSFISPFKNGLNAFVLCCSYEAKKIKSVADKNGDFSNTCRLYCFIYFVLLRTKLSRQTTNIVELGLACKMNWWCIYSCVQLYYCDWDCIHDSNSFTLKNGNIWDLVLYPFFRIPIHSTEKNPNRLLHRNRNSSTNLRCESTLSIQCTVYLRRRNRFGDVRLLLWALRISCSL